MISLRNKLAALLLVSNLCNAGATEIAEVDACGGQLTMPDLSFPIPNGCGPGVAMANASLQLTVTLTLATFANAAGSSPVGSVSLSWDSSNSTDILNGIDFVKVATCQSVGGTSGMDPTITVNLSTPLTAALQTWQQGSTSNANQRPGIVLRRAAAWNLVSAAGTTRVLGSNDLVLIARPCSTPAQFPTSASDGKAIWTDTASQSGQMTNRVFRADPTSSAGLPTGTSQSQLVLASKVGGLLIGPDAQQAPVPLLPVKLAFWILDGKTTRDEVSKQVTDLNALYLATGSGITFDEDFFFRDISTESAIADLWAKVCPIAKANLTGVCALASPVVTCPLSYRCTEGCQTIDLQTLANTTISGEPAKPFVTQAINVYFVPNFGASVSAYTCPPSASGFDSCSMQLQPATNMILVQSLMPLFPGALAHEIGHVFGLSHSMSDCNGYPDLDNAFANNLMNVESHYDAGKLVPFTGTEMSLGQILGTHADANSWLRKQLDSLPPGSPNSLPQVITAPCPVTSSYGANAQPCIPLYFDVDATRKP